MKRSLQILLLLLAIPFMAMAQNTYTITGKVVDKSNGDPLPGANIVLVGTTFGNASRTDGTFKITDVPGGTYKVRVSYVGYTAQTVNVNLNHNVNLGTVELPEYEFSKQIIVSAKRAEFRKTPVAFSTVSSQDIQEVGAANQDLSMATADIPNVYATSSSGGVGDSRVSVRGFSDNNVGILINGVPVNDMESGHMYWSDWSGLAQVANNIQVTMGLGSNPLSTEAVGGTINITTSSLKAQKGGHVTLGVGDYGRQELGVEYSTGLQDAGNGGKFGVTALVDRYNTSAYFNHSQAQGFTFFLTTGYTKGNNTINFTTFGTPQTHDQRTSALTPSEWAQFGYKYNPNVGFYGTGNNMQFINTRVNYYFKPVFSIDDTYRINDRQMITGTLYYSFGIGYGSGPLGQYAPSDPETGLLDFNQVFTYNANNPDTLQTYSGSTVSGNASKTILRDSHNDHKWGGLIVNYENKLTDKLTMNLSFDGRDYVGSHYRTVRNLMGGDFYVEKYNANYGQIAAFKQDKIGYYDLGYVKKLGGNLQLEYTTNQFSAFLDGSLSNTGYARKDYFIKNTPKTKFYNITGYIVKGGVNVNLTSWLNVFANAGYDSKAPYFDGVFSGFNNDVNQKLRNETVKSIELGIGLKPNDRSNITIDYYHTNWDNQTFNVSKPVAPGSSNYVYYNTTGLNEVHEGLEIRGKYVVGRDFYLKGGLAISNNYYANNVNSKIFNDNQQQVGTANLYIKDLKVSGAPQTSASLGFHYQFGLGGDGNYFFINPMARLNARYFASFNPENRTQAGDQNRQAYEINPYSIIDFTSGYTINFRNSITSIQSVQVLLSLTNLMDAHYISDAYDNDGTYRNLDVYFGRPRTLNVSFKVNF